MKKFFSIALLLFLPGIAFGQKPQRPAVKPATPVKQTVSKPKPKSFTPAKQTASKPKPKPVTPAKQTASKPKAKPTPTTAPVDPELEKAKLDAALALTSTAERASALKKFIHDFPKSEYRGRAVESLVTARAILGDEMLQANYNSEGIDLFKLAVAEAPTPIPERLFNEIVSKFPANLFYRDQRTAGIEVAGAIEKKAAGNAKQLLSLATFYLGIESGSDAKRLAGAAITADPNSVTAYQTLGLANRLNFDVEESARAYSRAIELDPTSVASKRSLAEMRRALGKPDEAAALYGEIVAANENDSAARTGLILSLFGAGKKTEAESEMAKSLEQNPKNLSLLAGAAYWYAANDSADKAVELAEQAIALEPRYIWGHIALARGLMSQKKPVEAERVLVMARQYGNFPTLEYEIASARLMAGFYREAVEELQKSFTIKDGLIQTRLGGRVAREEKSFAELIAYERRASIFEPLAADNIENAAKLKLLFEITHRLNSFEPDEAELAVLTDEFVKGDDKMKLHRQMYSATLLLQKNIALPKVLELVRAAIGNADAGLEVSTPAAAVMASELYESRTIAFARNEIIVVPDVPRQTLSAILRGRIEELTGWTLYQQKSYPEAVVRLRRAISVLPDKSAWWRSSMWRLGAALEADGKDMDALESYIQSYKTDRPSVLKYGVVESLYKKVHGSTEGLEAKIGPNPLPAVVAVNQSASSKMNTKPVKPVSIQAEAIVTPEKIVDTPRVRGGNAEKSAEKTAAREIPVKPVEANQPKADQALTADGRNDSKTQVVEGSEKTTGISEPKIENVAKPVKEDDTKAQVAVPVKAAETADPKIEIASTSDKQNDTKTQLADVPVKTAEIANPKIEIVSTPDKQSDAKAQAAEVPVKASEIIEPKVEIASTSDKQSDTKTQAIEVPEKTLEKAEDTLTSDKQNDVTKVPVTEVPSKVGDESQAKANSTITSAENSEVKIRPTETKKPEIPQRAPETSEILKKTESDSSTEPASVSAAPALNEKAVEKAETVSPQPQPQPNIEVPAKTEPSPNEPKNLLRDPFPANGPESKIETLPEKPVDPSMVLKADGSQVKKPTVIVDDPVGNGKKAASTKDLFEPVIIKVPSGSPSKSAEKEPEKPVDNAVSSGSSRVRVVDGKEIKSRVQCSIELSEDNISLINGGGSLGVLVRIAGEGDFKDIVATSSSPKDVEVRAEPGIEGISGRRFYVVKSVSTAAGVYQVMFDSPCGKKEIVVRIR